MENKPCCAAFILLAAGGSIRMGKNKLLMELGGLTPIGWCARAFAACKTPFCRAAVTVSPETRREAAKWFPTECLVEGGATRTESVRRALANLGEAEVVAIHDAARCLVTPEIIEESVRAAMEYGSGICALRARDTVRVEGRIVDRDAVMLAQTPQSFRLGRIREAYAMGTAATDDAALYEACGYVPHFCAGSLENQKLTVPEDVPFFMALLEGRHVCE